MAIIIEEERSTDFNLLGAVSWVVVLIILLVAAYYIFFTNPAIIDTALPADFKNTSELSKLDLKPEEISNDAIFKSLKPITIASSTLAPGRSNPFLPFR